MDSTKTIETLTVFLRETFARSGKTHAVLGVSGGVDSAVSLALTVRALGKTHVTPVLMPYGKLNYQGVVDATAVAEFLGFTKEEVFQVDITPFVHPLLTLDPEMDPLRKGNLMARVRMIVLFDTAKKKHGLVVGTENKTEHLLGYFTRFGDSASDIEPIQTLYKTDVYVLARALGLPEIVLTKAPTAGLWEGQTDEEEFGFTYAAADSVLRLLFDEKISKEEVVKRGFDAALVDEILSRVAANEFKHHLPYILSP